MKYFIFTTGCQQNIYDSKRISHLLQKMGYVLSSEEKADLIVVLSCSVRQKPIDRIWGKFRNWHGFNPRPKIIVTGCLLPKDRIKMIPKIDAFISTEEIEEKLSQVLLRLKVARSNCLKGSNRNIKQTKRFDNFNKRGDSTSPTSYVPIMFGCNNFCTYCAVPYTRGRERSRPADEILDEIKQLVKNGVKEITLLGQNVNSYRATKKLSNKKTKKQDFVKLLEKIEKIKRLKKISFLTSHPKDMGDDLIIWMVKSKKFSHELHLPLQSGDDEILRKMNRGYTARDYSELVSRLRSQISRPHRLSEALAGVANLKLSTDIIVGFPGETKKQFENTCKLCQKIGFDGAYVSQYSSRPGTASAKMDNDVSPAEKKRRWKILDQLINKEAGEPAS